MSPRHHLSNSTPNTDRERLELFTSPRLTQYVSQPTSCLKIRRAPGIPEAARRKASMPRSTSICFPGKFFQLESTVPHIDKPNRLPMAGKVQPRFNGRCKQTRCRAADGG